MRSMRFDLVETLGIAVLLSLATGMVVSEVAPRPLPELAEYEAKYGPDRQSQLHEEWLIRDFFRDRRGGVFVDVGANDYRRYSNTWYLETALGWSGIAVEPLTQFEAGYTQHRPRTRFRAFFVSDQSDARAQLFLGREPLVASGRKDFTERWGGDVQVIDVPTITLNDLLDREGVTRIDFLSMDIELAEPKALAGFDIRRFRPALACIEAHLGTRQAILDYFRAHEYALVGKYLRADEHNLYFTPEDH